MSARGPERAARILERAEHTVPAFADGPRSGGDPAAEALARAREQAEAEGYRRATDELATERQASAALLARTLAHLADVEDALTRAYEAHVAAVILEAASRIVRQQIDAGDPVAVRALGEAIDRLPGSTGLRARLHPQDLEVAARELKVEIDRGRISLASDDTLTRGGCVVESAVGTVDATVETAEQAVRAALLGESA